MQQGHLAQQGHPGQRGHLALPGWEQLEQLEPIRRFPGRLEPLGLVPQAQQEKLEQLQMCPVQLGQLAQPERSGRLVRLALELLVQPAKREQLVLLVQPELVVALMCKCLYPAALGQNQQAQSKLSLRWFPAEMAAAQAAKAQAALRFMAEQVEVLEDTAARN